MGNNEIATLVHNKTNRVVTALVYAILEWLLILLLLINGVFSYIISKFADSFGLLPPCLVCSHVGINRIFEPNRKGGSDALRSLLCDAHASDLSCLGYCAVHRRLADAGDMCEDCAASRPAGATALSWMRRSEMGEKDLTCSCCGVVLESGFYSPFVLSKPSGNVLNLNHKLSSYGLRGGSSAPDPIIEEEERNEDCEEKEEQRGRSIDRNAPTTSLKNDEAVRIGHTQLVNDEDEIPLRFMRTHVATHMDVINSDSPIHGLLFESDQSSVQPNFTMPPEDEVGEKATAADIMREQVEFTSRQLDEISSDPIEISQESSSTVFHEPMESLETHIEGLNCLPKIPEPRVTGSSTESQDGTRVTDLSVEVAGGDQLTVSQLKSALMSARESLDVLYRELEDERNAAAVAADETMAMINRLQEEKAAMQMEAVQYQRLMEEQSEYDQEAMDNLNELLAEKERERRNLEKELELYRHKVRIYESNERRPHIGDDDNDHDDGDDISPGACEIEEQENGLSERQFVALEESLAGFEEERLSILEQLKGLEDRLFELEDDDNLCAHNHVGEKESVSNGFLPNGDGSVKPHNGIKSKSFRRLLPLFDAVENGSGMPKNRPRLANEGEKQAIADEIEHVHERLQALEADREFLKHCMKSLDKGSKGLDLLQEILRHLRELRRVELQTTTTTSYTPPRHSHVYPD